MASVYLTSTNSRAIAGDWWTALFRFRQSCLECTAPRHHLVSAPEDAAIILFSDPLSNTQGDVREHALSKRFRHKVFIYSERDREVPLVPGVYTCTEARWYDPSHIRPGFYIKVIDHDWIQPSPIKERPTYLFSFCGSFDTHLLRRQLASLGGGFVRDTSKDEGRGFGKSVETYQQWQAEYFQIMHDSMFVLCPRGVVPSSYRIFKAMKAGRVPVIIADEWVPPIGPNWSEFALRVPQKLLQDTPQILERLADRAPEMGARAAEAWERWFSRERAFETLVSWCLQIAEAQKNQGMFGRYRPFLQLARPHFLRHVVRTATSALLRH